MTVFESTRCKKSSS